VTRPSAPPDRSGDAFGRNPVVAAELVQQVPGHLGVVAGVQLTRDLIGEVVETTQGLQRPT